MSRAATLPRATPAAPSLLTALRGALVTWSMRRRERAMLARLDTHLLRDIGLDPVTAATEARKPGWRA